MALFKMDGRWAPIALTNFALNHEKQALHPVVKPAFGEGKTTGRRMFGKWGALHTVRSSLDATACRSHARPHTVQCMCMYMFVHPSLIS